MWNSNGGSAPPPQQQPPQQQQQQQGPPPQQQQQWSPQPPNGQYTPRQNQNQIPPISQALPQGGPAMQTLQPQRADQYRALPAPHPMYAPQYPQPPQMQYPPAQPAPRQRTAIACRYCRRRKIRCSGFDQSEDGRCTNCQRFSQECIFTPVSAQTQAFVPAHTVWRGQNPPQNAQLYGAYGQPLPPGGRDPYQQGAQPQGQYPPPPQGYQQPPMYGQPPPPQGNDAGRKRGTDEPHTPTLPPPNPAQADGQPRYPYPIDPSGMPPGALPASYPPSSPHHPTYLYAYPTPSPHDMYQPSVSHGHGHGHGHGHASVPAMPGGGSAAGGGGVSISDVVSPPMPQYAPPQQAPAKLDGRTTTDSDRAADQARKEEARRNGFLKDVGVQVEPEDLPPRKGRP